MRIEVESEGKEDEDEDEEEVESSPLPQAKIVQIAVLSRLSQSDSLLMLIQSYLYTSNQSVQTGMQIDSSMYGVIDVVYSEPQGYSIITTETVISFHTHTPDMTFVEALLSRNEEFTPATELMDMLTDRLSGVESSIYSICELMMSKISRVMECDEPSAVSAGLLIQGYSGCGKTTILQTSEAFFRSKSMSVTYLDCSLLLSEGKRGESVAAIEAAMFPPTCTQPATCALHVVLLDNMDVAFQTLTDSLTAITLTSTLLNAIDTIRMQTNRKPFVVATCTDMTIVPESLFRLARFGEPLKISYPSVESRTTVASQALATLSAPVFHQLMTLVEVSSLNTSNANSNTSATASTSASNVSRSEGVRKSLSSQLCSILSIEIARRTQGYSVLDLISSIKISIGDDVYQSQQDELKFSSIDSFLDRITSTKSSTALTSTSSIYIQDFSSSRPPPVPAGFQHIVEKILRRTVHNTTTNDHQEERNQETLLRQRMGIKPCKGVIIYGPHGSGKTCLANRVAYESRSAFKFVSLSCAELVHKVVGESEKRLAELFRMARSIAPCFILLDNIEVILGTPSSSSSASAAPNSLFSPPVPVGKRHRTRTTHKAIDRILSTLLMELDGIEDPNESRDHIEGEGGGGGQVIVIATMSSHPKNLDSSLIRPGRLEEHIGLELPTLSQRRDIVTSLLHRDNSGLGAAASNSDDVIDLLAESTHGSSPAEIIQVVQEASMDAIRACIRQQQGQQALRRQATAPGPPSTATSTSTSTGTRSSATVTDVIINPSDTPPSGSSSAGAVDLDALHSSRKQHILDRLNTINLNKPKPAFVFSPH